MSVYTVTKRLMGTWTDLGGGFWRLWTAATVSSLGDGVRNVAIPLLAAQITHDPLTVSWVTAAEYLPVLLFALVSGVLADRYDRREIMWRVNLFRAVVVALFAAGAAFHLVSIPLLVVLTFLLGSTGTLFSTAGQSILPSVVRKEDLTSANSYLSVGADVSEQFVAPPLGAVMFIGLVWLPFGLDALSFAVAALLIFGIRGSFQFAGANSASKVPMRAAIKEGLVWLGRNPVVLSLCIMASAFSLFSKATLAIEVLYALEVLHLGDAGYGMLLSAIAVGSVLGSLVVPFISNRLGKASALYLAVGSAVAACVALGLTSSVFVAAPMFALFGVSMTLWSIVAVSLRQALVPKELLGRVNSAYRFISGGSAPLGALLGGVVADKLGLHAPYLLGSVLLTCVSLVVLRKVTNATVAQGASAT